MTDNLIFNLILLFFVVAPAFDAVVTYFLFKAWRKSKNHAIRERMISSGALFFSTLTISLLALVRILGDPVSDDTAIVALVFSLTLASVPSINWLITYLTDGF